MGCMASQRPSGETVLPPHTVGRQARGPPPNSPVLSTAEPCVLFITRPLESRERLLKPSGTARSRGFSSGTDAALVAGETRQRKPPPPRSAKSSPLAAKQTRVAQALVSRAPGPLLRKSQALTPSAPPAASHRPSGEKAADRSGPKSCANSRWPLARSNA